MDAIEVVVVVVEKVLVSLFMVEAFIVLRNKTTNFLIQKQVEVEATPSLLKREVGPSRGCGRGGDN